MKPASSQIQPPGLYLVASPIGNLRDISLRALDVLGACDMVICEDTRVSAKLLSAYGIRKPLLSYNDHNAPRRRPKIMAALAEGKRLALLTDAGTPLVSDPGYKLVREVIEAGCYLTALPGASSALAALCLSGQPPDRFFFAGFLPAKAAARKKIITELACVPSTLIFLEAPQRLAESLRSLAEGLGVREAAVARELTKLHEEIRRGKLAEMAEHYRQAGAPRGELVIVVGPPSAEPMAAIRLEALLRPLLKTHRVKEAAAILAEKTGRPRKEIYALALKLSHEQA